MGPRAPSDPAEPLSPGSPLVPCGVTRRDSQRPAGWRLGPASGSSTLPTPPPTAHISPSSPRTGPCPTPGPQVRPLPLTTGPLNPPGVPLIPKKPFPVPRAAPPPPRLWPLSLCGAPRSAVRCPADPEVTVATDSSPRRPSPSYPPSCPRSPPSLPGTPPDLREHPLPTPSLQESQCLLEVLSRHLHLAALAHPGSGAGVRGRGWRSLTR